jgi:cell division protein FtsN
VLRPRRDQIALTIPKNALWIGAGVVAALSLIMLQIGVWIGRGTAETPAPVSELVVPTGEPAEEPVSDVEEPPPPPPARPRAKLDLRERVPFGKHGIQIGAYPTKREAKTFLRNHAASLEGLPVYLHPARGSKGTWYRVRVGSFEEKEEAERARARLPAELTKEAMVVKY